MHSNDRTDTTTGLSTFTPTEAGAVLALMHADEGGKVSVPTPFSEPICLAPHTRVAGTSHIEDIERVSAELTEGDRLRLVRDAQNPYDRWAIRVLDAKGRRLGFVSADINEMPARLMDGGKRLFAQVEGVERRGGWIRIAMGVYLDD